MADIFERSFELENFANAYRNWIAWTMGTTEMEHGILFDVLYDSEYTWDPDIPDDGNRAGDGKDLRRRFSSESGLAMPDGSLDWDASLLEVLVGMAYRMESIMYDPAEPRKSSAMHWFWEMLGNMGISGYSNRILLGFPGRQREILARVQMTLERSYGRDGFGGPFPLADSRRDSREMPLAEQMFAYCRERM